MNVEKIPINQLLYIRISDFEIVCKQMTENYTNHIFFVDKCDYNCSGSTGSGKRWKWGCSLTVGKLYDDVVDVVYKIAHYNVSYHRSEGEKPDIGPQKYQFTNNNCKVYTEQYRLGHRRRIIRMHKQLIP